MLAFDDFLEPADRVGHGHVLAFEARELLGEMLLEMKRPTEALKEFEAVMKKEPNRFRTLYQAGRAADAAGDNATARTYFQQLVGMCTKGDASRKELADARSRLE